uniref:CUB domain-containing protein n=1 Tax=Clytia hemisphaerica TaxID=252671 RepID=A0A7M6DN33_9CNID
MKISCTSCKVTTKSFQTLFLVTILASLGNNWVRSTPQPKCTPYTDCIENHYVIYKSSLTVQSESRSNVEFYHFYNNSLSLKDQISYRLKWNVFQLNGNFPECEKDSVTVFVGNGSNVKQVGTFCGRIIPHDIYSLDGCFTLQLKNGRLYQSKFEVEVEFIPYSKSDSNCENLSISTESHGVILSPGWPTIPKSRSSCTWSIKQTLINTLYSISWT